jgi:hypothetical protein
LATAGLLRREAGQQAEREEGQPGAQADQGDQPGDGAHLALQRAGLAVLVLAQCRDPSQLGVRAGREDHGLGGAGGAQAPGQQEVGALEPGACGRRRSRGPADR